MNNSKFKGQPLDESYFRIHLREILKKHDITQLKVNELNEEQYYVSIVDFDYHKRIRRSDFLTAEILIYHFDYLKILKRRGSRKKLFIYQRFQYFISY